MRLILYCWESNSENIIYEKLISMGHEVERFSMECRHYTRDLELAQKLIMFVHNKKAQGIVSFDFFPIISMVCQTAGIRYYSWVYDCPNLTLYARQAQADCNRIGVFDRKLDEKLKEAKVAGSFHLPLAVDCDLFESAINKAGKEEHERFSSDISFVGSLYNDRHNYFESLEVPNTVKAASLELLEKNKYCYREGLLELEPEGELYKEWCKALSRADLLLDEDYYGGAGDVLKDSVMAHMLTHLERAEVMTEVAGAFGPGKFSLYTNSDLKNFPELSSCLMGTVDYESQMPLVFRGSRINLNVTLRSIQSGIPLRVLDIMACGGFVLTNYQPEIEEFLEIGKEVVTFENPGDCIDKINYYLSHEEERAAIAHRGYEAVKSRFTYEQQLTRLLGTD